MVSQVINPHCTHTEDGWHIAGCSEPRGDKINLEHLTHTQFIITSIQYLLGCFRLDFTALPLRVGTMDETQCWTSDYPNGVPSCILQILIQVARNRKRWLEFTFWKEYRRGYCLYQILCTSIKYCLKVTLIIVLDWVEAFDSVLLFQSNLVTSIIETTNHSDGYRSCSVYKTIWFLCPLFCLLSAIK